jgi:hypothetical protein
MSSGYNLSLHRFPINLEFRLQKVKEQNDARLTPSRTDLRKTSGSMEEQRTPALKTYHKIQERYETYKNKPEKASLICSYTFPKVILIAFIQSCIKKKTHFNKTS